ncbi:MAG: translocation/assembly module TamB domain-containing protein [Azoarcus sp.]|jgi:translocation and assembly module TamB|nr:translocation/assembly module TamB domain-containing protein [Azoarcus sp.]
MSVSPAPLSSGYGRRWFRRLGFFLATAAALVCAALAWLFAAESGLRTLADAAVYFSDGALRVEGARGALRGPLAFSRLTLDLPEARIELTGIALDWRPTALFSRVAIDRLRVERADVFLKDAPPSPEPLALPESLRLPFAFDLALEAGAVAIHGANADSAGDAPPVFALDESRLSLSGEPSRFLLRQLAAGLPQGRIEATGELGTASPFTLHLNGHAAVDGFTLGIDAEGSLAEPILRLSAQGYGIRGQARVAAAPFAALPLKTLELDAEDIDPAALAPGLPRANLHLHASLAAAAGENGEPVLRGPLRIDNTRPATFDAGGLPLTSLRADIAVSMDEARLDALTLEGGGGKVAGRLRWRPWAERTENTGTAAVPPTDFGRFDASLDLDALDPARFDSRLPSRRVDGSLQTGATAQRQWAKASLRAAAARIEADGEIVTGIAAAPAFALKLDLHDFDPAAFHPAAPPAAIDLQAAAAGVLAERPAVTLHFVFGNSRLDGKPLGGDGRLALDGAHVRDAAIKIDFAGNRLELAGDWGRTKDRLTLDLDAPRLAAIGYGLAGRMRAAGTIAGGLDAPAGTLRFDAGELRLPGNMAAASLAGEARIEAGDDGPLALKLDGSGIVAGDVRLSAARIVADGQRDRHQMRLEAEGKFGDDAIRLAAALDGGLDAVRWRGRLLALTNEGRWPLRLRAPAALEIGPEECHLVEAGFDIGGQGSLHLAETRWKNGEAILRGKSNGLAMTMLPGQSRKLRDPLTLGAAWDLRLGESIEGEARLFRESGDIPVQGEIATRLGLERLEAYLFAHNRKLTLALAAQGREAGELGVSLEADIERAGQGWRLKPQAPLAGAAHLAMPSLAWLGRLLRENVETGGALAADLTLSGTPMTPDLRGNIRGRALQLAFIDQGLILAGGDLEAGFIHHGGRQSLHLARLAFESANRVRPRDKRLPIDELTATPGHLRITGDIALNPPDSPDEGNALRGQFEFTAERLPLLQRADRWLLMSGQGRATLQGKTLDIDARLLADAGYIEIDETPPPSLGDDVVVYRAGAPESETGAAQAADGPIAVTGRISLDPGRALYLDAFGVDARLAGGLELQLIPSGLPRALGTIRTVDGSYRGYGQRLAIERGTITFQGDLDNPGLNIVAMRRGMEVDAGVAITGDARHPQIRLVSEPAVPDPEKLSWLVLGRAPDAAGADLALLVPAAQALFGGTGGGMTEELTRGLGIDSFTIGQGDLNSRSRSAASKVVGGGSSVSAGPVTSGDVVAVGKRLTNDLVLSFEQSLTGVESLVKLTYRLDRRLSLVARGGTDNALDLYYTFFIGGKGKREKARTGAR